MNEEEAPKTCSGPALESLQLWVSPELYRAFQRCLWILVSETGRSRPEIMEEMVQDFLTKYRC